MSADQPSSPKEPGVEPGDDHVLDHVAEETAEHPTANEPSVRSPVTPGGLPVEEQVRKEWDSSQGGLPTF